MKNLVDYVNGLQCDDSIAPVFSSYHNNLGKILCSAPVSLNNLDEDEKIMLDSDEITFIL